MLSVTLIVAVIYSQVQRQTASLPTLGTHSNLCTHFSSFGRPGYRWSSPWLRVRAAAEASVSLWFRVAAIMFSSSSLKVAVVCVSNINRSMEAHSILRRKGLSVWSFGTESTVRLPGPRPGRPVVYDFAATYKEMYNDLVRKDRECYTHNGILHILGRNERIKPGPERFQECTDFFDVIFTCEESVYDTVVEDLCSREQQTLQPVHVINMDIKA
uniref:RNA polymerase II subunit A C-terminal domain phosphatase SSU72 n=1 Tax=Papio anubis TaxID=9555 RepID=A0A8I5N333_PAPAN